MSCFVLRVALVRCLNVCEDITVDKRVRLEFQKPSLVLPISAGQVAWVF